MGLLFAAMFECMHLQLTRPWGIAAVIWPPTLWYLWLCEQVDEIVRWHRFSTMWDIFKERVSSGFDFCYQETLGLKDRFGMYLIGGETRTLRKRLSKTCLIPIWTPRRETMKSA